MCVSLLSAYCPDAAPAASARKNSRFTAAARCLDGVQLVLARPIASWRGRATVISASESRLKVNADTCNLRSESHSSRQPTRVRQEISRDEARSRSSVP